MPCGVGIHKLFFNVFPIYSKEFPMKFRYFSLIFTLLFCVAAVSAQETRYESLADTPFTDGYPSMDDVAKLKDELFFQRGVQAYVWMLPAMNLQAMKECFAKTFGETYGEGYHVMAIWKDRLNSKSKMLTPNSDVIYGIAFIDLKKDGPMVVEAPPGVQGLFNDFFQRPISMDKPLNGKLWSGDIGLPGPDQGRGGKYLILPPDYKGNVPAGYYVYRSRTYGAMVVWRGFFHDPKELDAPVKSMEKTRIYPLGKQATAKPMKFPNASPLEMDMTIPKDGKAFSLIQRIIDNEYVDQQDMEMRGMLAAIGIIKGKEFAPNDKQAKLLDDAAKTAAKFGLAISYTPQDIEDNVWFKGRRWMNAFPGNAAFTADTFNYIDPRIGFFTNAITTSPGMAITMEKVGAKYPSTFVDADGNFLSGSKTYKLHLPKDVPAAIFWSVTAYDSMEATLLDNGKLYSSINTMDKPIANEDGSYDVYLSPTSPGEGKNWITTVPDKGFFVILRLYGPLKPFFDQTWKPSDIELQK